MKKAKFKMYLEEDENFKDWYEDLQLGSKITADEQARVLVRYLERHDMTPAELLKKATKDRDKVELQLKKFVKKLTAEEKQPEYIKNFVKVVRGYLKHNGIELIRTIKYDKNHFETTDDRVPTQDELHKLLQACDLRTRTSVILIAHAGIRPQVLGTYKGDNGLRLKDIVDLEIKDNEVNFKNIPVRIIVPKQLSKTHKRYSTFLSREGCDILKAYLKSRTITQKRRLGRNGTKEVEGEVLTPDSPIISISWAGYRKMGKKKDLPAYDSPFIITANITNDIRKVWRKISDSPPRPYILRSYFDTRLLLAESEGKITFAYRQFFMGHKGSIEDKYTFDKRELPEDVIDNMRQSYLACEPYLMTEKMTTNTEEIKEMLLKQWQNQAELYGIKINDIELKIQKEQIDPEEAIKEIQQEIVKITAPHTQISKPGNTYINGTGIGHKIVKEKELVPHLNEGWELEKELNNSKFLIRRIKEI